MAAALGSWLAPLAHAEGSDDVVAVYSRVSPDYTRTRLAGGAFKLETYSFGEGGDLGGDTKDFILEKMSFLDIARTVAPSLAAQNYRPSQSKDPHATDLLIMVYWGRTKGTDGTSSSSQYQIAQSMIPPPPPPPPTAPNGLGGTAMASDPSVSGMAQQGMQIAILKGAAEGAQQQSTMLTALANRQRDRQNYENATILGYLDELKRVDSYQMTALSQRRQDIVDEVEESRYYVVLLAYDFQTLLQHKQRKMLWQTRFSIRERHNDFSQQLAAMAQSASRYFGQNSRGLLRTPLPATSINLGELKILGVEPGPGK